MSSSSPAILFLCLGNICRSPLAEGAARVAFQEAGIAAKLDSAGTGDWHIGRAPDPRAQAEAVRRGTDISDLRARQLCVSDFYDFDYILAADAQNIADARAIMPADATAKLQLMLDWVADYPRTSVTDPYYGDDDGFAETWADVSAVADALVRHYQQG
jgi:protein-tyrosine phosphatase